MHGCSERWRFEVPDEEVSMYLVPARKYRRAANFCMTLKPNLPFGACVSVANGSSTKSQMKRSACIWSLLKNANVQLILHDSPTKPAIWCMRECSEWWLYQVPNEEVSVYLVPARECKSAASFA